MNISTKHDKDCFNISQLRINTWNNLKISTQKLAKSKLEKHQLKSEVVLGIEHLTVIEDYWSFPGRETVKMLSQMLERKEYTALNNCVSENIRTLVSESYRDGDTGKKARQASKKVQVSNLTSSENYFEVLMVDILNSKEEEEVKERFKAIRGSGEKLSYNLVTATTFQDALIALLCSF
jgi:arginine decarboxylase